jgi:uncharacterized protein
VSGLELLAVAAVVLLASTVQITAGFGFALLAVPLMSLAVDTKTAVVVATLTAVLTTSWQATRLHRRADRALVKRLIIGAYVGMPVGIFAFRSVDENTLRLALGIAVVFAVLALIADVGLSRVGNRFDYAAGFMSGVLNTSLSTNGPPLVFDLQARKLDPDRFRATIVTVFALSNVLGLTLFLASGEITRRALIGAAVSLPSLFLGQLLGAPLRKHLHGERFRRVVLTLLLLAAASAILTALRS